MALECGSPSVCTVWAESHEQRASNLTVEVLIVVSPSRITELLESQEEAVAEAWGGEGEPARILHGLVFGALIF